MAYVEAFVAAVPAAVKTAYRDNAEATAAIFREFGARRIVETWGEDVPDGKVTDFKGSVKAKDDEVVAVAWIEHPDKAARDAANQRVFDDPRMRDMPMPFDGQRMIFGGFELLADTGPAGPVGFVDATVIAVPTANKAAYSDFCSRIGRLFVEFGASRVVDAWGDDVPDGKVTDFMRAVKAGPDETVAFGWVEWPSKAVRDEAWSRLMQDPRMHAEPHPFDGMRMIYGGFSPLLDVR